MLSHLTLHQRVFVTRDSIKLTRSLTFSELSLMATQPDEMRRHFHLRACDRFFLSSERWGGCTASRKARNPRRASVQTDASHSGASAASRARRPPRSVRFMLIAEHSSLSSASNASPLQPPCIARNTGNRVPCASVDIRNRCPRCVPACASVELSGAAADEDKESAAATDCGNGDDANRAWLR